MASYGFLGLGIMGTAMASNLIAEGLDVTVWNRTKRKCDPLVKLGAKQGNDPAEVVATCDITFAMVSDPEAAQSLCFGKNGVLDGISPGKGYIDSSTVDPATSIKLHKAVKEKGGLFLEAPVTGSKGPAEDGTLVFLCAGDESLYLDAEESLKVMGKKSFLFPEIGQGAQVKLINNMIMGTMMTALAEGLDLASKLGIDNASLLDVLFNGAVNNPMFAFKGPLMAQDSFKTAFPLKHMQKDMRLAIELGGMHNTPLQTVTNSNCLYIAARDKGYDDEDFSAVIKAL